jgi:acetyltransferase-like isoleucine patch superfamily enzyme
LLNAFRKLVKKILWSPPSALHTGRDSFIKRPRLIQGAQFIIIGDRSSIGKYSWLGALSSYGKYRYQPSIIIGNEVTIGRFVCLTAISNITIEDGCLLSEHVYMSDHSHQMDPDKGLIVEQPLISKGPVHVGANSFIGYRACILPGVVLGKHCIVGANSVVTRSFPDFSVIAGSPARFIRSNSPAPTDSASMIGAVSGD